MTTDDYAAFIASKTRAVPPCGFDWDRRKLTRKLFDWQKDVVQWGLRKGRAALFLDTGMGKTIQSLAWGDAVSRYTGKPVLYLCPLAVGPQTVRESEKFGIKGVSLASSGDDVKDGGVYVTNYHKVHKFDASVFGGVILGEASILKSHTGHFRTELCERFKLTPYKLTETATPSPNDVEELGNQAEFLGVCTRVEMLATYFTHNSGDTSEWELKGHAEEAFWRWVASWAMVMRTPADLGYKCDGYNLPPLVVHEHCVSSAPQTGRLFAVPAETLGEQRDARRQTMDERVKAVADIVNASDEQFVVWCELNDEGDALERAIPDAVQIAGRHDDDVKVDRMEGFIEGKHRVVVTKGSMFGFGLNLQMCRNTAFVGLSNSFESYYQSVRRFWRFGQTRDVHVHVVTSDLESGVYENVKRKQRDHEAMFARMVRYTADVNRQDLSGGTELERPYNPTVDMKTPHWLSA
jgi:hypothetical protein